MGPFSKQDKKWLREIIQQQVDDLKGTGEEETGQDAADLLNAAEKLKALLKKIK